MIIVLGFAGAKLAGKDTSADFFIDEYPETIKVSLADKIKTVCSQVFDIPLVYFYDQDIKEKEFERPFFITESNVDEILYAYGRLDAAYYHYDTKVRPHIGKIIKTPRYLLQYVGTEILRNIDPNIHCQGILEDYEHKKLITIPDIRFMDEYDYFCNYARCHFMLTYIQRDEAEKFSAKDSHESEKHLEVLKKVSQFVVDNNGTLEDLKKQILSNAKEILRGWYVKGDSSKEY